jgi:hypothetical protein
MIKAFIDHQIMQGFLTGLVDQVKSQIDLNIDYVKKRCKEKYGIEKIEGIEHKDGNIVVYKDQVACKLDYEVRFPMSVLITTKENIDSTPSQNSDMRSEIDDMPQEVDDSIEEVDDIPSDFANLLERVDDITEELDLGDLEQEHDVIDEPIEQSQMGIYKKKM